MEKEHAQQFLLTRKPTGMQVAAVCRDQARVPIAVPELEQEAAAREMLEQHARRANHVNRACSVGEQRLAPPLQEDRRRRSR
eukprot:6199885-Pleurochrysis_carterae.AAC.1